MRNQTSLTHLKTINDDVQKLVRRLHGKQANRYWNLFCSREPGSFDFRARMARAYVSEHIAYGKLDPNNPWQFPEETLVLRSGLCEDRAFLLAGLMLAAGISSFNVRVALGDVESTSAGNRAAVPDRVNQRKHAISAARRGRSRNRRIREIRGSGETTQGMQKVE